MIVGEIELYLISCFFSLVCVMIIYFPVRTATTRSSSVLCTPYQDHGSIAKASINHVRSVKKEKMSEKKVVCRELFKPSLDIKSPNFLLKDDKITAAAQIDSSRIEHLRLKRGGIRI